MALERPTIELVKSSWAPSRRDTKEAGALLFENLFTKFPVYLKYFPQFSDLNVGQIRENKRLLMHAIKVIDTVSFIIDSIDDDTKSCQLNTTMKNLVKSHLKRKIGLNEFQNLGGVIIDYVCQLNQNTQDEFSTDEITTAWTKFYSVILDVVKSEELKH